MHRTCSLAACALMGLLLLLAAPSSINAQRPDPSAEAAAAAAAGSAASRQLLVVNKSNSSAANSSTPAPGPSTTKSSESLDGSTTSSIGSNLIIIDAPRRNEPLPTAPVTRSAGGRGKKGSARRQQPLGRRGGPTARQAAPTPSPVPIAQPGNSEDYILPFCQPTEGVICADNDNLGLLDAKAAIINLDDAYAFGEFTPKGSFNVEDATVVDFGFDTVTDSTTATTNFGAGTKVGDEVLNSDTTVTDTLVSAEVDASRVDTIQPESVSVSVDVTGVEGLYEWKTLRPRLTYVVGQNFGLPVGFATVADGP